MNLDLLNGSFEFFGGVLNFLNIRKLWKDRSLTGISWPVTIWFTLWGASNLIYYPNLHQWISFTGGILIFVTNAIWLYGIWKFGLYKSTKPA